MRSKNLVAKLVMIAMLTALSIVLFVVTRFPIFPWSPWLEYEAADVPILIGGFLFGPVMGMFITFVTCLLQALTVSAQSGWVGFVMHMIATGTLVLVSSVIYKFFHTKKGAIIALIAGSLAMTLVMIPANLFFTVRFWGQPYETVKAMLWTTTIPFNVIKSFGNSIIVMLLYKSISRVFHKFAPKN